MGKIDVELLKKAGLDEDEIAKVVKDHEKAEYNKAKAEYNKVIEGFLDLNEVKAVVKIVEDAPFPIRLIVEKTKADGKATSKVQKPSGTTSNGRGGKQVKLTETDETYPTFAAACEACDLPLNGRSGRVVLEGAGVEYELIDAE